MTSENSQRPSAFGAFFSGGMSGLMSGAVMALIIAAVIPALPLIGLGTATTASFFAAFSSTLGTSGPIMVIASTLFGGVMSAKRALFETPNHSRRNETTMVPIPVTMGAAPVMAPVMDIAQDTPEPAAPTKSWVADTGRSEDARSRIQQILSDGSLSDKDRASAILASRQTEANAQASRA